MYLQYFIAQYECVSMYSMCLSLTHSLSFCWTSWCLRASLSKAQVVDGWVQWAALEARLTGDIYEGVTVWACVRDWQGRGLSDIGLPISRQESTTPTTPHPKGQALWPDPDICPCTQQLLFRSPLLNPCLLWPTIYELIKRLV